MQAGEASSPLVTRLGDFEEEEEEGEGNCADEARERGIRGFCRNRLTSRRRGTLGVFHRCPSRCIQAPRAFSLSPLTKRFYRLRIPRRQQAARSQLRLCIYEGPFSLCPSRAHSPAFSYPRSLNRQTRTHADARRQFFCAFAPLGTSTSLNKRLRLGASTRAQEECSRCARRPFRALFCGI